MAEEHPSSRVSPDELERRLQANPRFRKADPAPGGQVDITFIKAPPAAKGAMNRATATVRRVEGPTPNGGAYMTVAEYPSQGKVRVEITEFDANDEPVFRTYGWRG
jgi:hypothetical protein